MFRFLYPFDQRLATQNAEKDHLLIHNELQELMQKKVPKISDLLASTAKIKLNFQHEEIEH